jgi:HlyD family secretion protein
LQEQLKTTLIEKRVQNMFTENAATKRQVDEVEGKVKLQEQIKSVELKMHQS